MAAMFQAQIFTVSIYITVMSKQNEHTKWQALSLTWHLKKKKTPQNLQNHQETAIIKGVLPGFLAHKFLSARA